MNGQGQTELGQVSTWNTTVDSQSATVNPEADAY